MHGTRTVSGTREADLLSMYEQIERKSMFPFWARDNEAHDDIKQLVSGPKAVPFRWSYKEDIQPLLAESARLISTENTDRRSLILVNPGLAPRRATVSTLYTAYRQNDPNEIMPPHSHTASAIRFGLTGQQNFTGVEGEDITFLPGDMVLTPRDTWHNHGNLGNEPAINLSVLDYPLVENLNALSFKHDYQENGEVVRKQSARFQTEYSRTVYGVGGLTPRFVDHRRGGGDSSPMFVYRYDAMRELLYRFRDWDESPHEGLLIEYTHPLRGGPVYRTMTFFMQMIRPGEKTLPLKQTANLLVAPFAGQGAMTIGEESFPLEPFDTVAVPSDTWVQYRNDHAEPLILFIASDEPALRAMGLFHQWGRTAQGDLIELV
ncbi:1-hydroxy-2-naphthoate 1,2-dioxygenasee [Achromobacter anxifer]|uniref:cupin domain-containing protein n=1 Tax=Achromobacter anxifer TaxID=1287737 RepID=UPI00155B52DA|nr:cupin domain-containing protein [Achromobacter anxifer]CAB5516688.1 1-hydroxy-2-naphthoate 1,2-dioxygenasee [Achromobacter anxifer]